LTDDARLDIRARVDIVELVSRRVSLKRTGRVYKGLCPFHDDKNPSFDVNPDLGRYRCWSCGEHGDVFTWVMKTQNVDFTEALQILAEQAGITLSGPRPPALSKEQRSVRKEAMEFALNFFREALNHEPRALTYCEERGLDEAKRRTWELGFAPDGGDALANQLKRKGFPLAECRELFLVDEDSSGGYYDRFRGRLMFPIRDERGAAVAFGGRVLGKGEPKYINSSDTPIYHKSRVLYGLMQAREALQKERQIVLTEGYLDVIACHSAGVRTAVASCGTALAEDQCKLLRRWADEVVMLYDGDAAGIKAVRRAVGLLVAEGLRVKVGVPPDGEDPDSLFRTRGAAAVAAVVNSATSPMQFEFDMLLKQGDTTSDVFWDEAVELLTKAPNEMEAEKYLMRLAPLYPAFKDPLAAKRALAKEVGRRSRGLARTNRTGLPQIAQTSQQRGLKIAGDELDLFAAVFEPELRPEVWTALKRPEFFATLGTGKAALGLLAAFPEPPKGPVSDWFGDLPPETQALMEDVQGAERFRKVDVLSLRRTLAALEEKAEIRALRQSRPTVAGDDERAAYLERLRDLKGADK
jgi:DNA primase